MEIFKQKNKNLPSHALTQITDLCPLPRLMSIGMNAALLLIHENI